MRQGHIRLATAPRTAEQSRRIKLRIAAAASHVSVAATAPVMGSLRPASAVAGAEAPGSARVAPLNCTGIHMCEWWCECDHV